MTPPSPLDPAAVADLSARLARLSEARVAVLGDLMLDRFVYGVVERISPEAPIPVLRRTDSADIAGAGGNVAANLGALGASVALVGVTGDDDRGRALGRILAALQGVTPALHVAVGRPTTLKTRFVAGSQQLLRVDEETVAAVDATAEQALVASVSAALDSAAVLLVSDYGKGVLTPAVLAGAFEAARRRGRAVVVDPKGRDFARYRGAGCLTPNRRELAAATGLPTGTDTEVEAAARAVIAEAGVGSLVVTRSEQGLSVVAADRPAVHFRAEAREVYDVSGAGDTVLAALGALLATGAPLEAAARLANVAGGIVVGKAGTATVTPPELAEALVRGAGLRAGSKLLDLAAIAEQARRWRAEGLTIGFTNGCFDLLHPGHLSLMRQARAACDRLVVGLNGDESVRRLKGPDRPVQSEAARAEVLEALDAVDRVVIFDEDTPELLIRAIRPDVLVKGADYARDAVVGADFVESYGGRVLLAALSDGHSTTGTIRRLRGAGA